MKKIVLACVLVLASSVAALAGWVEDFQADYQNNDLSQAVVNAMKEGVPPAQIIDEGLRLDGVNPIQLIQALYCAGASGTDVGPAALDAGISQLALSAGYEKSIAECQNSVTDTQAYTPAVAAIAPTFAAPVGDGGNTVYASTSTFQ